MTEPAVIVRHDTNADPAHIALSDRPIRGTIAHGNVVVDVDDDGDAVGVWVFLDGRPLEVVTNLQVRP